MEPIPDNRIKCPNCGTYNERWSVSEDAAVKCIDCEYIIDTSSQDKED